MTSQPAHRLPAQRGPVQAVARLLFLQLLAVIVIAAAITTVAAVLGPDRNDDVRAIAPSGSASSTPGPTDSASTSPPAATGDSATPPVSTSPATSPGSAFPQVVKVDVLNQSAPNGSAGKLADRLHEAGWPIGRIEDFHGNVRTTTVYWLDPEQRRQARQISRFMGGVRVRQGFDTLVDGRVSVILVQTD